MGTCMWNVVSSVEYMLPCVLDSVYRDCWLATLCSETLMVLVVKVPVSLVPNTLSPCAMRSKTKVPHLHFWNPDTDTGPR